MLIIWYNVVMCIKRFSQKEIKEWPEGHKACKTCLCVLPLFHFNKNKNSLFGRGEKCRSCRGVKRISIRWDNDEISSWEDGHKRCKDCGELKLLEQFHRKDSGVLGRENRCAKCRNASLRNQRSRENNVLLYTAAKNRAKKKGIPFNIELSDVSIPEKCPVLNVPLSYGHSDFGPSLDRIVPSLGYTKGNVIVISRKANRIKNDASPDEILAVGNFYKNLSA